MKLRDKTIFLIEDNLTNLAVMTTILERAGAKVHVDRWGQRTVQTIQKIQHLDVILTDLMLPRGISGYDVYKDIQICPDLQDIPTVIVSASDPALEMRIARDMGFAGYISKPINHHTFATLIAKVIDGEKVWADDFAF